MIKKQETKLNAGLIEIRKKIDQIDKRLILLLTKRFDLTIKALDYKQKILDPKREKEILTKISSPYLKAIFRQILKSSKKQQILKKIIPARKIP